VHQSRDLFGNKPSLPEGFRYGVDISDAVEEQVLLQALQSLPFKEFEFHCFTGKRRVVSFGWRYDFNGGGLQKTHDMPSFLLKVRDKAATFAQIAPSDLQQLLVTEYSPGAAIGWHKDRSVFGRRRRPIVCLALRFPLSPQSGLHVGTGEPYRRAAFHLSAARPVEK
jgi:alkylated DNA repair dioxygenase AlkB